MTSARTWLRLFGRLRNLPIASASVLVIFAGTALLVPWLPIQDPTSLSLAERLTPPVWVEGGSTAHPLGTDTLGRDILAQLAHGARVAAVVGAGIVTISAIIGTWLGLASGYYGGVIDSVITRLIDATLTIPVVLAALIFVSVMGPGVVPLGIALVLFLWGRFARVVRGEALRLRELDFVRRSKIVGNSTFRTMRIHVLPHLFDAILIMWTINLGIVIIAEASLSFLGLGIPPPTVTWGQMVADGRGSLREAWWIAVIPGGAITLVVLAVSQFGDWMRDRLAPKAGAELANGGHR